MKGDSIQRLQVGILAVLARSGDRSVDGLPAEGL